MMPMTANVEKWEECGRWLLAGRERRRPKARTDTWFIISKVSETILGEVRWFGRRRQYSFYPEPGTIYNGECLRDIEAFLAEKMRERK